MQQQHAVAAATTAVAVAIAAAREASLHNPGQERTLVR